MLELWQCFQAEYHLQRVEVGSEKVRESVSTLAMFVSRISLDKSVTRTVMTKVMTRQENERDEDEGAHNGEEDDEDGDDCHDACVLAGLGILKQEPDAPAKRTMGGRLCIQMHPGLGITLAHGYVWMEFQSRN